MAYQLWVTGRYDLSGRILSNLKDVALVLRIGLINGPLDFTVQCYSPDGTFSRAFGGALKLNKDSGIEVTRDGCTTNDEKATTGMQELEKYLTYRKRF